MSTVDIIIIIFLILYTIRGFHNGFFKEIVSFIGGFLVIAAAYVLKNPLSVFLYDKLPFIKFGGMFAGISVINIVVYELLSFIIVASVLWIIYKIVLNITNIVERILELTVVLDIPSKIFGIILGFVEGVVVVFVLLFVCMQLSFTKSYIEESKYSVMILEKTPILSKASEPVYKSMQEIYGIAEKYKGAEDKNAVNLEALDTILKYKVIDVENAEKLISEGKLNITGSETVIEKYKK